MVDNHKLCKCGQERAKGQKRCKECHREYLRNYRKSSGVTGGVTGVTPGVTQSVTDIVTPRQKIIDEIVEELLKMPEERLRDCLNYMRMDKPKPTIGNLRDMIKRIESKPSVTQFPARQFKQSGPWGPGSKSSFDQTSEWED